MSSATTISDMQLHREAVNRQALSLVSADEAWDHLVLPMRYEDGELLAATTQSGLASGQALLAKRVVAGVRFFVCDPVPLEQCIACYYDYEGLADPGSGCVGRAA